MEAELFTSAGRINVVLSLASSLNADMYCSAIANPAALSPFWYNVQYDTFRILIYVP